MRWSPASWNLGAGREGRGESRGVRRQRWRGREALARPAPFVCPSRLTRPQQDRPGGCLPARAPGLPWPQTACRCAARSRTARRGSGPAGGQGRRARWSAGRCTGRLAFSSLLALPACRACIRACGDFLHPTCAYCARTPGRSAVGARAASLGDAVGAGARVMSSGAGSDAAAGASKAGSGAGAAAGASKAGSGAGAAAGALAAGSGTGAVAADPSASASARASAAASAVWAEGDSVGGGVLK